MSKSSAGAEVVSLAGKGEPGFEVSGPSDDAKALSTRVVSGMTLGSALERLRMEFGQYRLLEHHQQGEFHHDVIVQAGGYFAVLSANCNGGLKEMLVFDEPLTPAALWHARCPDEPAFGGELPPLLARVTTCHHFDPCELLAGDARSELKPEFRRRQSGGGWEPTY